MKKYSFTRNAYRLLKEEHCLEAIKWHLFYCCKLTSLEKEMLSLFFSSWKLISCNSYLFQFFFFPLMLVGNSITSFECRKCNCQEQIIWSVRLAYTFLHFLYLKWDIYLALKREKAKMLSVSKLNRPIDMNHGRKRQGEPLFCWQRERGGNMTCQPITGGLF